MKYPLAVLLLPALVLSLAACQSKKGGGGDAADSAYSGSDSDRVNGTPLAARDEGTSFLDPNVSKSRFRPVHFAFDSFRIEEEDQGVVRQVADFLQGGRNRVIVAGFCDERGTADYNRALGEKRAEAVRESLIADGVDPGRIQTVSYGAEMPLDPSSNESAWAKNRRAEFGVAR